MLTGDNPLTACHVAKELKISQNKQLVLSQLDNKWVWQKVGGDLVFPLEEWQRLSSQYDLCLTGDVSMYDHTPYSLLVTCEVVTFAFW